MDKEQKVQLKNHWGTAAQKDEKMQEVQVARTNVKASGLPEATGYARAVC